jgi:hypothetical protein
MRCGDASANYDYIFHPGTHDHLCGPSTERGLSDRDICGPTNDGVSVAVLGPTALAIPRADLDAELPDPRHPAEPRWVLLYWTCAGDPAERSDQPDAAAG